MENALYDFHSLVDTTQLVNKNRMRAFSMKSLYVKQRVLTRLSCQPSHSVLLNVTKKAYKRRVTGTP